MLMALVLLLTACNKEPESFPDNYPVQPVGPTLGEKLASNPSDSLYYRLVVKSGALPLLNDRTKYHTLFVPDNDAMKSFINFASQNQIPVSAPDAVFSQFITNFLPATTAAGIVQYNSIPQKIPAAALPTSFPNLQYPSILNPAPQLSAFFRLTDFVSARNGAFLNNIAITYTDAEAANGLIHGLDSVNVTPTEYLWDRIDDDPGLTLLKAAIQRADSAGPALQGALQNIGANFTVFAPTNLAMKQLISALTGGQVPVGAPDAIFLNIIQNAVPVSLAGALIAYHVFDGRSGRPGRAFLNNFAVNEEVYKTLLNSNPLGTFHPGVGIKASFTNGLVSAATVKAYTLDPSTQPPGVDSSIANVIVNPYYTPFGSSDQHYLNGVLHKIDRVLVPIKVL